MKLKAVCGSKMLHLLEFRMVDYMLFPWMKMVWILPFLLMENLKIIQEINSLFNFQKEKTI